MPFGYLISRSFISSPAEYELRRPVIAALLRSYGGRYLVRTLDVETVVGGVGGFGLALLEFPTMVALEQALTSPEVSAVLNDMTTYGQMDSWGVPGVDVPVPMAPSAGPRGYLIARANVSGHRRIQRPVDLLGATVTDAGGRILIRSGQIQVVKSQVDVNWLTVIEMPSLAQLKAALPKAGAPGTEALYKSMEVEDLWIAPGVGPDGALP